MWVLAQPHLSELRLATSSSWDSLTAVGGWAGFPSPARSCLWGLDACLIFPKEAPEVRGPGPASESIALSQPPKGS